MFSRDVLNALFPSGAFWTPAAGDDYDNLMEGIAENTDRVRSDMEALRYLRDPARTTILSDLEKEYGVIPVAGATIVERRERLAIAMFRRGQIPISGSLEDKLQAAGFNCYVHDNDPPVDPDSFLAENFGMTCGELLPGGNDAQCGEVEAICSQVGGELLVNGEFYEQQPNYTVLCGEADAQCGEADALAGDYDSIRLIPILYTVPAAAGYWGMIFFVGGPAVRDPGTGEITDIGIAQIPIGRKQEFKRIILKYKPMSSWAGLIVVYV